MRSCIAAILAAVLILTLVAAGTTPAWSQDFSITNPGESVRVEGAQLGPDWIRKLQAWWNLHAYYPKDAAEKDEAGIVKLHLLIHANGEVWLLKVVEGSGSKAIDNAAFWTFHNMHLEPFPPGVPASEADVYISLHYVMTHRRDQPMVAVSAPAPPRGPFTITNDPVKNTVFETKLQRDCSGVVVQGGFGPDSILGYHARVTATFYRKPDGTPWLKWWGEDARMRLVPVAELGVSAQWTVLKTGGGIGQSVWHYAVWPAGENGLTGTFTGGDGLNAVGSIDLNCEQEVVPRIKSSAALELP